MCNDILILHLDFKQLLRLLRKTFRIVKTSWVATNRQNLLTLKDPSWNTDYTWPNFFKNRNLTLDSLESIICVTDIYHITLILEQTVCLHQLSNSHFHVCLEPAIYLKKIILPWSVSYYTEYWAVYSLLNDQN